MDDDHLFQADRLTYRYGRLLVFQDVSFDLQAGEVVQLLGPNGSGKSTLLRCLAAWTRPASGSVQLRGEELGGPRRGLRSQVVLVPDQPPFFDDLTAGEHVQFVLKANRLEYRQEAAQALLDGFGLASHLQKYPSAYSRGMRQKLALCLMLMLQPAVILADEPFGSLDPEARELLIREIRKAADSGAAVLVSSPGPIPELEPSRTFWLHEQALHVS